MMKFLIQCIILSMQEKQWETCQQYQSKEEGVMKKGYSGDILQIIEEGCELEDIFSLLPDKFDGVIDNMRRKSLLLLKNYEEYNHFFWLDE